MLSMLFEEDFPLIKNDEELSNLKSAYSDLDEIYVVTGSIKNRRDLAEYLWSRYSPYAEKDFIQKLKEKGSFNQRAWELYLGATMLDRGFKLIANNIEGPDLQIEYDEYTIWIEATAPGSGEIDPVPKRPDIKPGEMHIGGGNIEDNNRPKVLRITHAIRDKQEQYKRNLKAGLVKDNEPFIVAVNGNDFSGIGNMPDYLMKWVFFAAGPMQYRLQDDGSLGDPTLAYRPKVEKYKPENKGVEEIECGLFCNKKYSEISAVVFTFDHLINADIDKLGSNLILVRNPFAKNALPESFWKMGREWIREGDKIIYKNHDSENINPPY